MATPNLDRIRKNSDIGTVFVKFLAAQKLSRLYQNYYEMDAKEAWDWFSTMTQQEKKLVGNVHALPAIMTMKAIAAAEAKNGGTLSTAEKTKIEDRIKADSWGNIYIKAMETIGKKLEELATDTFLKSKEYQSYVKKTIKSQGSALRKDLKLEADVDDVIGLAFALETGDTGAANRISVQIAKAEVAAGRKGTSASSILKMMRAKVAQKFGF
ncbi:hypothetical protein [Rhizobium halophytocola]|uniref:Uncharacterized protein n=1 Tax=Rhizobium halophytocola TaxID=735519 RepID=A0ABS4E3Q4_9HYPH|nr:hypothetical protein [Rhizobium halophytocola]MBP1852546.1 hypothetical protein [Rhizobium halophytocola]